MSVPHTLTGDDPFFRIIGSLAGLGLLTIDNARGEFACNSSSSHSIVVLPEGFDLAEDAPADGGFGWENFSLTSSTEKVRYLAAMLRSRSDAKTMAKELRAQFGITDAEEDYVDHESVLAFPEGADGSVEPEFIQDLARVLSHPRVAILGGNDNDDPHPLNGHEEIHHLELPTRGWRLRKDTLDGEDWWTMFNLYDGTKVRMRLNDPTEIGAAPAKSAAPELADVKLTDRCAFEKDCGFCYMGSTTQGPEGDALGVMNTVSALADMGVFEIAFGGGEPTLWPHLKETLRFCRSVNVVPNITTKNYTVMHTDEELFGLVGAVAFSVNDNDGWRKFKNAYQKGGHLVQRKATLQIIPEIIATPLLEDIFQWCAANYVRLTLLGYKTTGRGNLFDGRIPRPDGFWIDMARKAGEDLRVAIDTVLAEKSEEQLHKADVPSWCYHTVEGKSSLYIDAVTGHVGPSSYCDEDLRTPLNLTGDVTMLRQAIARSFETY